MATKSDCETQHYYVGATIDDRYHLTEFIGAGGMACVYRAQETGSPHTYAIKFLKSEYHNQDYLIEYFREEASSMRDLAHPNIVRFYRFVNHTSYSYIIMDYVDGFSLADIIKRMYKRGDEIPLDEVIRIMTQVARAIDAIHREGYVHRDIKPGNVLIQRQSGQTFLTDLGITTASNTRMEGAGTVAYMPPEMMETWVADHRADIYSYGIMLFEMLAKERPFRVDKGLRGRDAESNLKNKHKSAPVPDITDYRRDLPAELNTIMQKALAKDPDHRYESVLAFTKDVHRVLKPKLSADMQDFTAITHRFIDAPDMMTGPAPAVQEPENNTLIYAMLTVGLVAIVLAGVVLFSGLRDDPRISDDRTPSNTPAPTLTATPVITATPNPISRQPVYTLVQGINALAEIDGERLAIPSAEDGALQYLRVGMVDGFRVQYVVSDSTDVTRSGIAFRVQDNANYQAFRINPQTGAWQFVDVIDNEETVQKSGTIDAVPATVTLTGREDYFQVELGDRSAFIVSSLFDRGSLALYVEGTGELVLDALDVALIGPEAQTAVQASPTPAEGIADPRRFLRADLEAMLATNDLLNSAIDCPRYIDVYETLERHLDSSNREVRLLAQDTIDAGEVIYSRCRAESPDAPLTFITAFQDYLAWEENLRDIQSELAN
jgi:serine/threonine protein kinase